MLDDATSKYRMHGKICLLVDSSTGKMDVFYRKATGTCFGLKKKYSQTGLSFTMGYGILSLEKHMPV